VSVLDTARKAVFGETWALPGGVAVVIAAAELAKALAPGAWHSAGGFFLLAASATLLVCLVRRKP
jgi:hypothetical protein